MGEVTKIAWTDHTLNPWIGCHKASAGCANCYAEHAPPTRAHRAKGLELWGASAERHETKGWITNLAKWDRAAGKAGVRRRVFCASLADVFEGHDDLPPVRAALFRMLERVERLDIQLLTKRPQNIRRMVPDAWLASWPAHVWIGTTVEDQRAADERIPHLLRIPAAVRFLSVEPMLGPVDLTRWIADHHQRNALLARNRVWGTCVECPRDGGAVYPERCVNADRNDHRIADDRIHWVICGGESGPRARPFGIGWARSLRDQCAAAGVAFFMKQLGANAHVPQSLGDTPLTDTRWSTADSHGADESEWPDDLRECRAFPEPQEVRP